MGSIGAGLVGSLGVAVFRLLLIWAGLGCRGLVWLGESFPTGFDFGVATEIWLGWRAGRGWVGLKFTL